MNTKYYRSVMTHIGILKCPKHINRIDARAVGWQVRIDRISDFEKYHSKLFSDSLNGGTLNALAEATHYLELLQKNYRNTDQLMVPTSNNIDFKWRKSSRLNILQLECSIHICQWQNKRRVKTLYVGTENTVTQKRIDYIKSHALKIMEWRNQYIELHGRGLLFTADIPDNLT